MDSADLIKYAIIAWFILAAIVKGLRKLKAPPREAPEPHAETLSPEALRVLERLGIEVPAELRGADEPTTAEEEATAPEEAIEASTAAAIDYDETGFDEAAFLAEMRRRDFWKGPAAPAAPESPRLATPPLSELLRDALVLKAVLARRWAPSPRRWTG